MTDRYLLGGTATPAIDGLRSIATVPSVQWLLTAAIPDADIVVDAVSYYTASTAPDGGGGPFQWNSASTATHDGGTVVLRTGQSAGTPGRWLRIYSGDLNALWFGADPTGSTESGAFIQVALDLLENVFIPQGLYKISTALKLRESGQKLYGAGYGPSNAVTSGSQPGTTLRWFGTSGNFIEILSNRRDQANTGLSETGMQFSDFKLESDAASTLDNAIWIEDGVFHSIIERVHLRNFAKSPSESFVKFDSGGGLSYPVGMVMRDVTMRGSSVVAVPKGIFMESAIEAYFDRVFVYDCEECWVFGTSVGADYRNVSDITITKCQAELVSATVVSASAIGMRFYAGNSIAMFATKIDPTSGATQTALKFTGVGSSLLQNVTLHGCEIWGSGTAQYAITVDSTAGSPENIRFLACRFTEFATGFANVNAAATPQIIVESSCMFYGFVEPIVSLSARGFTLDAASIADGGRQGNTVSSGFWKRGSCPALLSFSLDLQGLIATHYKSAATDSGLVVNLQNETGLDVDLASGVFRIRPFAPHEVKGSATVSYDPPSLADGVGTTTTLIVPGAALGDFVSVAFKNAATGNLSGIILTGYVSAADTVAVRFQNETGGTLNLPAGNLTAYVLRPCFTYAAMATYDPPSIADAARATTTITVTGAALGDFVVASFSLDLQGIMMTAYVSAANTVTVDLHNETGGLLDLASGTLRVGVYDNGVIQGVP